MDIWDWVEKLTDELEEAGQDRAASLFYRVSGHIVRLEIPQAEALLPEALAMAKTLENPWAEVFFRHWEMRLRLGIKGEGESALPAVVDLLDFAHSEECEGCPQTICTTQDIAACYANMDGPGWAEERRAVALEGLAKIDTSWNCYYCLSDEYIRALYDENRYDEAMAAYEEYCAKLLAGGKTLSVNDITLKADILLKLGQPETALETLDIADKHPDMEDDERRRMHAQISRAEVLTCLGRVEEAREALPSWGGLPPGNFSQWLRTAGTIALGWPQYNTWSLGSLFQEGLEHFSRVGAHRSVIDIGKLGADLAMQRAAYSTPRRILGMMKRHLPKLRYPLGADLILEELERAVGALAAPALPVPVEELVEYIKTAEHPNAEIGLDWMYTALDQLPDDIGLLLTACSALAAMNAQGEAREMLWSFIKRNPENCEDAVDAIIRYTPLEISDELHELANFVEPGTPYLAHWVRLYIAYRNMSREEVAEQAQHYIALRPDAIGARSIWANAEMSAKNFAEATRLRKELIAIAAEQEDADVRNHRWDLLVAATCAMDWKLVRDTCIAMGIETEPGDTPIDDPGQYIYIRYKEDGEWITAMAQRNGPVTARITSGFWKKQIQRTHDLVVFDPELLEPYPEDEEERKYFYPPYGLVHTLEKGGYQCWLVDGFYPGQDEFTRFRSSLEERGFCVDVRCPADYTIDDPEWEGGDEEEANEASPSLETSSDGENNEAHPFPPPGRIDGIYFLLGAKLSFPLVDIDAILTEETKDWEHPLCWYELAKNAGKPVEKHQAIIERYGL